MWEIVSPKRLTLSVSISNNIRLKLLISSSKLKKISKTWITYSSLLENVLSFAPCDLSVFDVSLALFLGFDIYNLTIASCNYRPVVFNLSFFLCKVLEYSDILTSFLICSCSLTYIYANLLFNVSISFSFCSILIINSWL